MQPCGVREQAAMARLLMAAAVPDNAAGMADRRPHPCRRPLDRLRQLARGLRRRPDDAARDRDVPRRIAVRGFGPLVHPGMALFRRIPAAWPPFSVVVTL